MNRILDDYVNQQNAKPGELVITPLTDDLDYSRHDCMGIALLLSVFGASWLSIGVLVGWMIWR